MLTTQTDPYSMEIKDSVTHLELWVALQAWAQRQTEASTVELPCIIPPLIRVKVKVEG